MPFISMVQLPTVPLPCTGKPGCSRMICWMRWGPCLPKTGAEQGKIPSKKKRFPSSGFVLYWSYPKHNDLPERKSFLFMVPALEKIIAESDRIVFFGGAGVSTESGIPDFRSVDGLYHQKYDYPPETILSHTFWEENPEEFYRFYRDKLIVKGAKPNAAHLRLAKLEREGRLKAIVTQNIDGLHQAAGSKTVYELHGSTLRNYCVKCGTFYDVDFIANSTGVPRCPKCGGIVKPDVVLYEEGLDEEVLSGAVSAIRKADTLIIGGTSLVVYPAAGLIRYFRGRHLVVINMQPTGADAQADLCIAKPIGQVLSEDVLLED